MKDLTETIFGAVPDEAQFRWLSPEEFMALPRAEKDAYLYAVYRFVARKPSPKAGERQGPLGQS